LFYAFGEDCSECDSAKCTKCKNDNLILVNGICANCSVAHGEGCNDCNPTSCSSHSTGYFISDGRSVKCDAIPDETAKVSCKSSTRSVSSYHHSKNNEGRSGNVISISYGGKNYDVSCSDVVSNCNLCSNSEGFISCSSCADGYVLYGGVCMPCNQIHGNSCQKCSLTSCEGCGNENIPVAGVCQTCVALYPFCSTCNETDSCTSCDSGFIAKNGKCVTCQSVYGAGCMQCDATECIGCVQNSCCAEGSQIIVHDNGLSCSTCDKLTNNCATCTWTQCLTCNDGFAVDPDDSYKCKECSKLFNGCSKCDSDVCKACMKSDWILTDNGCITGDLEPQSSVIENPPSSSSSSTTKSDRNQSSSKHTGSLNPASEKNNGKRIGIIVGSVVGGVVAAIIITAIIIYFVRRRKNKRSSATIGFVDEDDGDIPESELNAL